MGFDNECILNIQNLAGEYFCPVCRMLVYPNEALQSQCTHLYCKPCLTYIVATTRACPYDGYLVTQEDSKPLLESNKTLAESIGKIDVHCLYHRSGCTWQGSLSDCLLHCSTCAFGNCPVVCNRCAIQIVHRQVQEHAQSCTGGQSQVLTSQGALSSAISTTTNQMQATVQGAMASSLAHASHIATALLPGQVPSQSSSTKPNLQLVAQAAIPVTNLSYQQQVYEQYVGYDPYQQHYQQYSHQQQLMQHHPMQPQPQCQYLPPPAARLEVQTLPQHQPLSLVCTQPSVQHYPQSLATSVSHQSHPSIHPQSHANIQNHVVGQRLSSEPSNAPQHSQLHPQQLLMPQYQQNQSEAQPHVRLQASQVHHRAYPLHTNYMSHYPPVSHMTGDHSYPLQPQAGNSQRPFIYSYHPDGFQQQQQHQVQVKNQVSQQLMNPAQIQTVNQKKASVIPSPIHHLHMLHYRPPVQAVGQPLAPQYPQQQSSVTIDTHMYPRLDRDDPPSVPQKSNEIVKPQQSMAFPYSELHHQSQSQTGWASNQMQTYYGTNEGVYNNKKGLEISGLSKQLDTGIVSDNQPQPVAEQQSGDLQPLVGSQCETNNVSAENSAVLVRMEGKETAPGEYKHSEVLFLMSASRNGVPSDEKGANEERVNDSEEHLSVGRSDSFVNDLKGDPAEVMSKGMDSHTIQSANTTDEISPHNSTSLAPSIDRYEIKTSFVGLPSNVRPPSASSGSPFKRVTGVPSEIRTSLVPCHAACSAPCNHLHSMSQVGGSFPTVLDSDKQMTTNAPPYVFEGRVSMPTDLMAYSKKSFDGRQPCFHNSESVSIANLTPASLQAGPDSLHTSGWHDERFEALRDKMLLEKGSQRMLQNDLLQFATARPPDLESEHLRKQEGFFSLMSYERDSFGFSMIPKPLDKTPYGLPHDELLQPSAFPGDKKLGLRGDLMSEASIYGCHFGVHDGNPSRKHPDMSSRTILSGRGSIPPLSEVGCRSNLSLAENLLYKGDLRLSDNLRKRKAANMGWCRICKVDCDTVEGLDLHSQTREHQRMSMDMVLKIKQQNSRRQK